MNCAQKYKAKATIEQAMEALGIAPDMHTDPAIIQALLHEMRLDDFETTFPPMQKFLADAQTKPQPLGPMFDCIKHGIVHKHPAIVEFAELAIAKNWFSSSEHIQRAVHVTYILEAMTAAMCNNHEFYIEAENHVRSKERLCGIDSKRIFPTFVRAVRISHSLFKTMKGVSVDAFMIFYQQRCGLGNSQPNRAKRIMIRKTDRLNSIEMKLLSPTTGNRLEHVLRWIRINIYEAGITEYQNGFEDNAFCAQILNESLRIVPPETCFRKTEMQPAHFQSNFYKNLKTRNNLFPILRFDREWVSLYITWNMSFVFSDLDDLDLIMPSLFIPSIINTNAECFMGVRGISLWLTVNNYMFRAFDHATKVNGPVNKKEMAIAWGKINKKYALALAKTELHESPQVVLKGYNRFFSHPIFNFMKLVVDFAVR